MKRTNLCDVRVGSVSTSPASTLYLYILYVSGFSDDCLSNSLQTSADKANEFDCFTLDRMHNGWMKTRTDTNREREKGRELCGAKPTMSTMNTTI